MRVKRWFSTEYLCIWGDMGENANEGVGGGTEGNVGNTKKPRSEL